MPISDEPSTTTFVLTPPAGADLRAFLEAALAERRVVEAWITAYGTLNDVELRDSDSSKTFATSSRIVSLVGSVEVRNGAPAMTLTATVGRPSMRGLELIAGEISRARVDRVRVAITALTSRTLDSSADDVDGSTTSNAARNAAPQRAASPWDAVAEASERSVDAAPKASSAGAKLLATKATPHPVRAAATPLSAPVTPIAPRKKVAIEEFLPEIGDAIDHFAFGRCRVLKSDGEELLVRDESTGKTRTIHLSVLEVSEPIDEAGVRVFICTQRRGPPVLR
jgi:predicted DNA-binding protein with PD1-like motif